MGEDTTKEVIKTIVTKVEPTIVLYKIWREMAKYITLQKLTQTIQKGDWEAHRKDPDIADFITEEEEL